MAGYNKDTAPHYRPSREGKKTIVFYTNKELSDELRMLAIKEDTTLQALCNEAVESLLTSRGVKLPKLKKAQREAVG